MDKEKPARRRVDTAEAQDRYRMVPLASLKAHERNANVHPAEQIKQLEQSLLAFGWTRPIGVADGVILFGHGISEAARNVEQSGQCPKDWPDPKMVPVVDLSHLNEAERRAYVIADNETAKRSHYDMAILKDELVSLQEMGVDLGLLAFDQAELDDLLKPAEVESAGSGADADELPEDEPFAVAMEGEVWVLGRHRLVVGDPADPGVADRALGGVKPHLLVTEVPAGGEVEHGISDWREALAMFPGDVAYLWHDGLFTALTAGALEGNGFTLRAQIIWDVGRSVARGSDYPWQHQPCWYAAKEKKKRQFGGRGQSTIWRVPEPERSEGDKRVRLPVECLKRCIENSSSQGQAIYDPFAGAAGGSTMVAAELSGRSCHAVEAKPLHADVVIGRWQKLTGQDAILEGDGRTYADLRLIRAVRPGSPGA